MEFLLTKEYNTDKKVNGGGSLPNLLEKIYFEEQDQTMLVLSTKQNFKGATAIVDGTDKCFMIVRVHFRSLESYRANRIIVVVKGNYIADKIKEIV